MEMRPIAHIKTDLPQKFGIPRNSFLAPHLQGRIVFEPEFGSLSRVGVAMEMRPIAHIKTDLPQKFGIPRNSFLAPHLQGRIVFEPEVALPQAVEGLEEFSHLWLLWECENGMPGGTAADIARDAAGPAGRATAAAPVRCDEDDASAGAKTGESSARTAPGGPATASAWAPTVRPPRLGGSERRGVFATRSPFRPNPIGLT